MDSNSSENKEQTNVDNCADKTVTDESNKSLTNASNEEKSDNNSASSQLATSVAKPEAKDKSVKCVLKHVESRYKQSTQQWVNKRADNTHNSSQGGSSSRPLSRNPTPERKKTPVKKASTPMSTDKSLNMSGVSVINKTIENKTNPLMPDLKRYGKALVGRKSIAPKRLPFDPEPNTGKSGPMAVSALIPESETKNKEFEESIKRSINLQTIFLTLKAKQARTERKVDAFNKISAVWKLNNQFRDKLSETQRFVHSLEQMIETIDDLENQKSNLKRYLEIRSKVDPLFNSLSQLIDSQKRLLKLENCSEEDFLKINELLESCPKSEGLESAYKATESLKDVEKLTNEIKSMETQLQEYHKSFEKCVQQLDRYDRIENNLFPEKSLSLKRMF